MEFYNLLQQPKNKRFGEKTVSDFFLVMFHFSDISFLAESYPDFTGDKTLLNITHYYNGNFILLSKNIAYWIWCSPKFKLRKVLEVPWLRHVNWWIFQEQIFIMLLLTYLISFFKRISISVKGFYLNFIKRLSCILKTDISKYVWIVS